MENSLKFFNKVNEYISGLIADPNCLSSYVLSAYDASDLIWGLIYCDRFVDQNYNDNLYNFLLLSLQSANTPSFANQQQRNTVFLSLLTELMPYRTLDFVMIGELLSHIPLDLGHNNIPDKLRYSLAQLENIADKTACLPAYFPQKNIFSRFLFFLLDLATYGKLSRFRTHKDFSAFCFSNINSPTLPSIVDRHLDWLDKLKKSNVDLASYPSLLITSKPKNM